jgi:hypothetical protein
MSEQRTSQEIPDKFFLNEMKREVVGTINGDLSYEHLVFSEFVDLESLQELIRKADNIDPSESLGLINKNPKILNGLWNYYAQSYAEVIEKSNIGEDIRVGSVALCSAAIKLARVVDFTKQVVIGKDASTDFVNLLASSVVMHGAKGLVARNSNLITEKSSEFITKLADDAFKKISYESGILSWSWAKVHSSAEAIKTAFTLHDILGKLPEMGKADTEMLRRQNDEMVEASVILRTYTPKPAVGDLGGTDLATLFLDKEVSQHLTIGENGSNETHIKIFKGTALSSSNVKLDYARAYKHGGLGKRVAVEGAESEIPHADIVFHNGDITVLGEWFNKFASSIGMPGQGELLRAMLLAQNFDLTVPSYIVDLVNEEAGGEGIDSNTNPTAEKMRRLIVARIRALKDLGDGISEELSRELKENEEEHKDIAKHGVVGHLRRLPQGYKASLAARVLCKEQLGVEVPEGHTYVQIHERGNIEVLDKGHKINIARHAGRVSVNKAKKRNV